jgi:hypothetical protein
VRLAPPAPAAGLEVRAEGLRLRSRRGENASLVRPDALTRLDGLHLNAADDKALAAALAPFLAPLPRAPLALLLPTRYFRAFALDLGGELPKRRAEVDALLRFRLKRLLPYKPEAARLSFRPDDAAPGRLLALAAYDPVLRQWEHALEACGVSAGWVLPASFAALAAWRAGAAEAEPGRPAPIRLLIDSDGAGVNLTAARGGAPLLLRSKSLLSDENAATLAGGEAALTVAYLRDKLQCPRLGGAALSLPEWRPGSGSPEFTPLLETLAGAGVASPEAAPAPLDWIAPPADSDPRAQPPRGAPPEAPAPRGGEA